MILHQIELLSNTRRVFIQESARFSIAPQKQVNCHFASVWNIDGDVGSFAADIPRRYWPVNVMYATSVGSAADCRAYRQQASWRKKC